MKYALIAYDSVQYGSGNPDLNLDKVIEHDSGFNDAVSKEIYIVMLILSDLNTHSHGKIFQGFRFFASLCAVYVPCMCNVRKIGYTNTWNELFNQ